MANTPSIILGINILPEEQERFIAFREQNPGLDLECVEFHSSVAAALGGLSLSTPVVRPEVDLVVLGLNYDRSKHTEVTSVPAGLMTQMTQLQLYFPRAQYLIATNAPVWAREDHGDQYASVSRCIDLVPYTYVARFFAMIVGDL